MTENAHNDDLLIRYMDGELSPGEKAALEDRLQTDKELREELMHLQVAVQAVKQLGTVEEVHSVHLEMMKELKGKQQAKVVSFTKSIRYGLAIAASLVVLFAGVKFYQASQLSPDKIYSETFVAFNVSSERGTGSQLSTIETLYQQKNYDAVTTATRSLNLSAKDSLLIGLSYLQTERPAQAIGFLQAIASSANDYQQDAEFYLALSYLKNKAYSDALPLMEKIKNDSSHLYHGQVSEDAVEKVKKLSTH